MRIVAGLGNPGRKYQGTRHNVGFLVLGRLAEQCGQGKPRGKFQGEVVEARIGGQPLLLLSPLTYMNRSGSSVLAARDFYKTEIGQVLVICDDFHLPLGKLRIRPKGSSGGQRGLEDIIRRLGTQDFARLRIGVGEPPEGWEAADYVLGKFARDELPVVQEAVDRAARAVHVWVTEGIDACMNEFNS